VSAPAAALAVGLRIFAAPAGQPRSRRAADVVLFVPALLGVLLATVAYPPSAFERSLARFLASFPAWLDPLWGFLSDLLWLFALALLAAALFRRRFGVVGQALAAMLFAAVVGLCAARLAIGSWPDLDGALRGTSEAPLFPDVRVAEAAAVIIAVSPHVVRPLRRLGRWIIALGVLGVAMVGVSTPAGAIAALLVGIAAAAGTRLAFGTSAGRPSLGDVAAALAQLGVRSGELEVDERQVSGVFHVRGVDEDGRPLLVKVYGRDAYDTQVVATLWRTIWYRGSSLTWGRSRLHSAEREAFVTLLARNAGLATREVVTAAATIDDDALLVLRGEAQSFAALGPDRLDDALLRSAWGSLGLLGELRIAHQQIDPSTIVVVGREAGFVDLGEAILAPDARQLTTDRAQLLVSTASLVGNERALQVAVEAVGAEGIAELVPYLQAAAFSTSLRRQLKAASLDVDEFREQAAVAVGIEPPEAVKLRRVTKWAAVQMALLVLAAYTIIDAASGVDWGEVRSTVADASWAWIAGGLVVAQLPRLAQAVATLGSVPVRLPLGPVYAMQLAMSYMNVALPSNLARMAVNIRFFQRQGLSAPTAVASGAIDSFASTVVQALLLALLLIFSESSLALDLPFPSGGVRTLLWLLAGALVASILTLVLVRRLRELIADLVRRWWPDVRAALGALRASHKLALLVLGSLATELLFAIALGLFARSFGYDISLAELLVINISVSLLASVVPVPGGVGVAEFGLTLGLTSAGMTAEPAVAAVLLYRIATFYLPPLWGFFALRWLQRNRYL